MAANSGPMPLMASNMAADGGAAICCAASNASRSVSTALICSSNNSSRSSSRLICLQMVWQRTTIARPQFVEPSPTVTTQRFVPAHALREQQSFNAIAVLDSLGDQHFALAAETATILFLGSRCLDHCAHP